MLKHFSPHIHYVVTLHVKLDTSEMTDIPQMLRLNCFGDNLSGMTCTQTYKFFRHT